MKVYIGKYKKSGKDRDISIKIHKYDVWNMDYTLALIIFPMLVEIRSQKISSPHVDDDDVPEEIRSTNDPEHNPENFGNIDKFHHQRWSYVLDEMIYAFQTYQKDSVSDEEMQRISEGFRLFGKYYMALWT